MAAVTVALEPSADWSRPFVFSYVLPRFFSITHRLLRDQLMMSCAARRRRRQSLRSPIPLHCRAVDPHSEHSLGAAPAVVKGVSCETMDGKVVHFCDESLTN